MKTLFLTFSVHNVYRNLFLFPGNFWEQLRDRVLASDDLRVVVLLRPRDRQKYAHFFDSLPREKVIVEEVEVSAEKNFIQAVFRFLYAYLVYTGTTRVLTTIGMRQDEPPAATNRLLAPVRSILGACGATFPWLKRVLVPWLHARVFPDRPFRDLFDRYRPDLVFATHIYGEFDAFVLREARARGVRTVATPSGWDHVDKYYLPFQADLLLVPSEQVRTHAIRYQAYRPETVRVTGYPHFDFMTRPEAFIAKADLLARFDCPPETKFILYVSGSAYCPDEPEVIEQVLAWIDAGAFGSEVRLILRPYLGSRSKDKAFDEQKFARIAHHPRVVYYDAKSWDTIGDSVVFINLMRHASAVLCVYSTVFLEAVVFDSPLVAAPFDGSSVRPYRRSIRRFRDFEHFREVLDVGAVREAFSFPELRDALAAYLADPTLDREKREAMRREACGPLDGTATRQTLAAVLGEAGLTL